MDFKSFITSIKQQLWFIPILGGFFYILDFFLKWKMVNFFKNIYFNIKLIISSNPQGSLNLLYLLWLLFLSFFLIKYKKQLSEVKGDFLDNFKHGLKKWEWESGDISIENGDELSVTKCNTGILTRNGQNWSNYIFEFETKIIKKCSAWIVRARDFNNYVMFQFNKSGIRLHYRIDGEWVILEEKPIRPTIRDNEWFKVRIEVKGDIVIIFIKDIEIYQEKIFSGHHEIEGARFISFPMGRVGFREWAKEQAYFRNIGVNTIP